MNELDQIATLHAETVRGSVAGATRPLVGNTTIRPHPTLDYQAPVRKGTLVGLGWGTAVMVVGLGFAVITGGSSPAISPNRPAASDPAFGCVEPPESILQETTSAFSMTVTPQAPLPGTLIDLEIGAEGMTGVPTIWQCWDGSGWKNVFVSAKADPDSDISPEVFEWDEQPRWAAIGLAVPGTFTIQVPDLAPGTYRIQDSVGSSVGFTVVQVGNR